MLIETKTIDRIEILEDNSIQVRERTDIVKDDRVISFTYHRWCISPGEDYSTQDSKVQSICKTVHTQENIENYQKKVEKYQLPTAPNSGSIVEPENPMP